jgi:hypothetical protein
MTGVYAMRGSWPSLRSGKEPERLYLIFCAYAADHDLQVMQNELGKIVEYIFGITLTRLCISTSSR